MVKKKIKKTSKKIIKKNKTISKKVINKKNNFKTELSEEIEEVEKWIVERKNFFIKFGWVVLLVLGLLIISNIYLKVGY